MSAFDKLKADVAALGDSASSKAKDYVPVTRESLVRRQKT